MSAELNKRYKFKIGDLVCWYNESEKDIDPNCFGIAVKRRKKYTAEGPSDLIPHINQYIIMWLDDQAKQELKTIGLDEYGIFNCWYDENCLRLA